MSSPMEIFVPNPADIEISEQNGVAPSPPPASPSPIVPHDKFHVSVEVCLKPSSTARPDDVPKAVEQMLEKRSLSYVDGPVPVPIDDPFLMENVQRIRICDTDEWVKNHDILLFWQVKPVVHVFQLSEEGPCEELSGDGQLSSFNEWILPAKEFDGMWESLIYESGLKQRLLRYAASALLFTEKGVDPFLVSCNRIILLHGPPGTGKTSLCKALAQKLSIRFSSRENQMQSYHLRIKENSLPINVQASITGLLIAVKGVVDTTMRKSNGYTPRQNSGWDTTSQDYRSHLARMERLPTIIPGASQYPSVHKAFNNKYSSEEEVVEIKEEHHQKQRSPKSEKKVQVVEHVETIEETRDGNCEVYEETTVDAEAGGYIQQKHKAFELCKWKTFKVH